MIRWLALACSLLALCTASATDARAQGLPFLIGADVSSLEELEAHGVIYRDGGVPGDLFAILAARGFNAVRLRVWVDPTDGYCDLASTLALAQRAKAEGMHLLIDLHYSDTWADPGQQTKPAAWSALPLNQLTTTVHDYTASVVAALIAQGTPPDLVQIGNEIIGGMLWNEGRVGGAYDTPAQWQQLAQLLEAASAGVQDASPSDPHIPVMIHIDRGGDAAGVQWFFDNLTAQGVVFDMIGLSYYPWWHGDLGDLQAALSLASTRYGKPVVLVETAYPWTLSWYDLTNNLVGLPGQLLPGYPATPAGQSAFLAAVANATRTSTNGLGAGVFYWEPAWVAVAGSSGSAWENVALFDEDGDALSSIDALPGAGASAARSWQLLE